MNKVMVQVVQPDGKITNVRLSGNPEVILKEVLSLKGYLGRDSVYPLTEIRLKAWEK